MILALHKPRGRGRGLGRPKSVFTVMVLVVVVYYCLLKGEEIRLSRLAAGNELGTKLQGAPETTPDSSQGDNEDHAPTEINETIIPSETKKLESTPTEAAVEQTPPKQENPAEMARRVQAEYEAEYIVLSNSPGAGSIYGGTVANLKEQNTRSPAQEKNLYEIDAEGESAFNPYPNYNSKEWKASHAADYVPCEGPTSVVMKDIRVFKGRPRAFPDPGFGSYEALGIDKNICFEREDRLGQYGFSTRAERSSESVDWANVKWGDLQKNCIQKNKDRFDSSLPPNIFVSSEENKDGKMVDREKNKTGPLKESRTAILLRSYTGKDYTENDKQVIRSLVTELNLRTGGEYQVFLFVHVKNPVYNIFEDHSAYQFVIQNEVPREFWGMTILWNDDSVKRTYSQLDEMASKVHNAQYLSVQKFMQENREFDFVWNWEMDSRVIGHHYDFVSKLAEFGKRQPRRGLWERNERFYIREVHGDYDMEFRKSIERIYGNDTVWGAPEVVGVNPLGPKPPVQTPQEDNNYEWGVGEEADLITLSPIFNPVNSNWILGGQIWGFQAGKDLPRRATIITQSRFSRRLLDLMHVEDLKGNHVASEMMPQTISLLHGLKAVYAPMPVFFDRPWTGVQLDRWFNPGPKGESGGIGSAMGWGRETRFQGSTWYFRADPPQRMYNNWMGYEDSGIGGQEWEGLVGNGRPCLPSVILHPVKDVRETPRGYSSKSNLPYR